MGSCYSHRRASNASEIDIPFPTVGKNRPLKKKLPKWTLEEEEGGAGRSGGAARCLRGGRELERMRAEFWDTAPAFEGRKEIWDALRVAATALLHDNDFALAQAILDGANITLPRGSLTECYDELGARYKIPAYCIAPPSNLLILKQQQPQQHQTKTAKKNGGHLEIIGVDKDVGAGAGHLTSSSCVEDEPTTTNVEDELDEMEIGGYIPTANRFALKSRPWQDPLTPGSAPTARSSSGSSSSSSRPSHNSSRQHKRATGNPVVDTFHGSQISRQATPPAGSTLRRLASLVLGRHHQKVTSLARGNGRHNPKNGTPSSLAPPPQTVVKLKLRLGTCGTDYELSCALRDTVLSTKRRLAKKVLFERLRHNSSAAGPDVVVDQPSTENPECPETTPVKQPSAVITKREISALVQAQRWLLSGKIIPDKMTIAQAKIPPGFVIQVALCGPTPSNSDPPPPTSLENSDYCVFRG